MPPVAVRRCRSARLPLMIQAHRPPQSTPRLLIAAIFTAVATTRVLRRIMGTILAWRRSVRVARLAREGITQLGLIEMARRQT
jgi:hypothetical protein